MSRPITFIHSRPWWLPSRRWLVVATATACALAGVSWWAADPVVPDPASGVQPHKAAWGAAASPFGPVSADPTAPSPPQHAAAAAVLPAQPVSTPAQPVSTMVAPGVHITPMSVPPGTFPMPAGPGPDDSEPEN